MFSIGWPMRLHRVILTSMNPCLYRLHFVNKSSGKLLGEKD